MVLSLGIQCVYITVSNETHYKACRLYIFPRILNKASYDGDGWGEEW